MKKILFISLIALYGCGSGGKSKNEPAVMRPQNIWDSLKSEADKMPGLTINLNEHFDTSGIANCPLKLVFAIPAGRDDLLNDIIHFTFTNTGNKDIAAFRFRWYAEDAFHEPTMIFENGVFNPGDYRYYGNIKPGKTVLVEWSGICPNVENILGAWAYEVAFEDGTTWKIAKPM